MAQQLRDSCLLQTIPKRDAGIPTGQKPKLFYEDLLDDYGDKIIKNGNPYRRELFVHEQQWETGSSSGA